MSGEERTEFRMAVRLTQSEYSQLAIDSILKGVPPGDLLRDAYFPEGTRQDGDD